MIVSIVVPVFNEASGIEEFLRRTVGALESEEFELVFVNDGSSDATPQILDRAAHADPRIRVIHLSRNFGHQAALSAGMDAATGEALVTIDADLQDPPEVIPALIDSWRGGADVVHAVRHVRPGESRRRILAIRWFYKLFGRISGLPDFPGNSGDFRLLSRRAADVVSGLPERNKFLRGLSAWVGFEQARVEYERDARYAGDSKYPFSKLLRLAVAGIVSFSPVPLRIASMLGALFAALALLAIPAVIVLKLSGVYEISGIASVHILVLLIGGIQLLFLGVLGEYLSHNYDEAKGRPVYIIASETPSLGSQGN